MAKKLIQIDFNEALKRAEKGERVYATDLSGQNKSLSMKLFNRLEIGDALKTDYVYQVVEEVEK